MALKDLDFKPLEVWAREAIADGDAAGMTIATSNKPGGSSWEAHGFSVDESLLDTFKDRAGAMFKSKRLAPVVEIELGELVSLQGGVWRDERERSARRSRRARTSGRVIEFTSCDG